MNKTQKRFTVRRLTLDAVLVAVYFALSMLAVPIGGLKLTFEHLPIIICAVAFGPVDALLVGLLGEFMNQMLTYGFTPTTLLWTLPALFRGLSMGLCARLVKKHLGVDALMEKKFPAAFAAVCVISGVICSCINTFAFYVDSKMFGYYSYAMVFGVFWLRIGASAISSVVMAVAAKPVVTALRRGKMI